MIFEAGPDSNASFLNSQLAIIKTIKYKFLILKIIRNILSRKCYPLYKKTSDWSYIFFLTLNERQMRSAAALPKATVYLNTVQDHYAIPKILFDCSKQANFVLFLRRFVFWSKFFNNAVLPCPKVFPWNLELEETISRKADFTNSKETNSKFFLCNSQIKTPASFFKLMIMSNLVFFWQNRAKYTYNPFMFQQSCGLIFLSLQLGLCWFFFY